MAQSRNKILPGGVTRYGRSAMYKRKVLYMRKKNPLKVEKVAEPTTKTVPIKSAKGKSNGESRTVAIVKPERFHLAEPLAKPMPNRKRAGTAKLRASLTPGSVVVLLAGPFRGKRAVFLKQLPSGLLLVTGPFGVNGVPLRRVNQAYVIGTSTSIDISKAPIDDKFNDAYFARPASATKATGDFFQKKKKKVKTVDEGRKADQKAVDAAILKAVAAVPNMKEYLGSYFTLTKGQYPHEMIF